MPISGGWLFWDKLRPNTLDFGSGELAYNSCSNVVKKYAQKWNGAIREGSKNLNPQPLFHPTQKPVELHMKILQDFSKENDIILDCFGGSGTTLIACEMTGRTCLMMEISPQYCDIICDRYNKLTGLRLFDY
ncbi:MAG: site-specific DNA-methyltransferase [Synergistaceae bacterium]|nr:site-specific DNA-methyltransferase [Synergistaceae bacterium]